jgi:hypothetical protein
VQAVERIPIVPLPCAYDAMLLERCEVQQGKNGLVYFVSIVIVHKKPRHIRSCERRLRKGLGLNRRVGMNSGRENVTMRGGRSQIIRLESGFVCDAG